MKHVRAGRKKTIMLKRMQIKQSKVYQSLFPPVMEDDEKLESFNSKSKIIINSKYNISQKESSKTLSGMSQKSSHFAAVADNNNA